MRVYVESNFALEVAFEQEEASRCEDILALAESGDIGLVLPAYSFSEAYEVLVRRSQKRSELREALDGEFRQLRRSEPYREAVERSTELVRLLVKSGEESKARLEGAMIRIVAVGEVIPLDASLFSRSLELQRSRGLGPQDALVYASVLDDLEKSAAGPKLFITRNPKDFLTPEIEEDLGRHECRLIPKFGDGLDYIRSQL